MKSPLRLIIDGVQLISANLHPKASSHAVTAKKLREVFSFPELAIVSVLLIAFNSSSLKLYRSRHQKSFIAHMSSPFRFLINSIGYLYFLDVVLIVLGGLGLVNANYLPSLCFSILSRISLGCFITKFKDWQMLNRRVAVKCSASEESDQTREKAIDNLTSSFIWLVIGIASLENLSRLGISVTSIFAFGGLGSATLILALRATVENIVGGILLQIQDKFRVGEKIATSSSKDFNAESGWVESIGQFCTIVRREDNSRVTIPNSVFMHGELINWSRTPYRLFENSVVIKAKNMEKVQMAIDNIRIRIKTVEGLAEITTENPLLVEANHFVTSFVTDEQDIVINVACHLIKYVLWSCHKPLNIRLICHNIILISISISNKTNILIFNRTDRESLAAVKSEITQQISLGVRDAVSPIGIGIGIKFGS